MKSVFKNLQESKQIPSFNFFIHVEQFVQSTDIYNLTSPIHPRDKLEKP